MSEIQTHRDQHRKELQKQFFNRFFTRPRSSRTLPRVVCIADRPRTINITNSISDTDNIIDHVMHVLLCTVSTDEQYR